MKRLKHILTKQKPFRFNSKQVAESQYEIYKQDVYAFLASLPDESVDLVVTDPPYESLEKWRKIGTTTRLKQSKSSSNKWFDIFPNSEFPKLFSELHRVLKNNSHCYLFCDQETMHEIVPMGKVYMKYWKDIIWEKIHFGMGYHYRNQNERILFFEKGKRKLNNLGISDVLSEKRIWRGYPTEKPVPLVEILIAQSTDKDMLVIDPFMGSCSTGVAALRQGRRFKGCDTSKVAFSLSKKRLFQETHYPGTPSFSLPQENKDFGEYMNLDNFMELDDYHFDKTLESLIDLVNKGTPAEKLKEEIEKLKGTLDTFVDKDRWFFKECIGAYNKHMLDAKQELAQLFRTMHDQKVVLDDYSKEEFSMYDLGDYPILRKFLALENFERLLCV